MLDQRLLRENPDLIATPLARRGIKADDNLVAALCMSCHHDIDQGAKWSKKERQQAWVAAHMKTVQHLTDANQWPVDVPLPSEAELTRLIDSCQN